MVTSGPKFGLPMQPTSSPQEVAELELALEKSRQVPAFRVVMVFFWGLIMAKCLLAQWAAIRYQMPLNTTIYVWALSLGGSGALTLSYAWMLFRELPTMPLSGRLVSATWAGCATGFGILALAAWAYQAFNPYLLPALGAVLLGMGCYIHSVFDRRRLFKALAFAWWLAALGLFTQTDYNALGWMGTGILLLIVLPSGWLFLIRHRKTPASAG